MVALLVFIIFFGQTANGNGGNVFKDPARYIINIFDKEA